MNLTQHLNALAKRANPKIRQQMLTAPIVRAIPALGYQDGLYDGATAYVKFFGGSRWTWYATEASPVYPDGTGDLKLSDVTQVDAVEDVMFFGYVISGLDERFDEFGYFRLLELAQQSFPPFGLPIERDMHFVPVVLRDELHTRWGVTA